MTPKEEAQYLVENADQVAEAMLEDMDGEECVDMVRQFCSVMASWQPNIKENIDDPVLLGLHCLAAAQLFRSGFLKAYQETDNRLKAQEAVKKALEGLQ